MRTQSLLVNLGFLLKSNYIFLHLFKLVFLNLWLLATHLTKYPYRVKYRFAWVKCNGSFKKQRLYFILYLLTLLVCKNESLKNKNLYFFRQDFVVKRATYHAARPSLDHILTMILANPEPLVRLIHKWRHHSYFEVCLTSLLSFVFVDDVAVVAGSDGLSVRGGLASSEVLRVVWQVGRHGVHRPTFVRVRRCHLPNEGTSFCSAASGEMLILDNATLRKGLAGLKPGPLPNGGPQKGP